MPTYEYACKSCGSHLEVVQSFKDDPLTECPSCAGPLRKVFGSIGITFKGSGFYKTDSRSTSTSSSSGDGAGAGKESTTKESKDGPKKDSSKKEPSSGDSGASSSSSSKSSKSSSSEAKTA